MKTKTIDGRKQLVVTYRERRGDLGRSWDDSETINVFREGRKIVFTNADIDPASPWYYEGFTVENANLAAGAKALVRLFQDALDGKTVKSRKGSLSYTHYSDDPVLHLERKGSRILFTAPCGQEGYITVREAEKLVAEIPTL